MSPIANMLAQIRNAQSARKTEVVVPFSKIKQAIADILVREGFVASVETKKRKMDTSEVSVLHIGLKPDAISGIKLISKPSRRMYSGARNVRPVRGGVGLSLISTSRGIVSNVEAKKQNIGGEVLFEIW